MMRTMSEYTYEDIIIDPTSEEAKNAIGKECYMNDYPTALLNIANNDIIENLYIMESINEDSIYPFVDKSNRTGWVCIIVKRNNINRSMFRLNQKNSLLKGICRKWKQLKK